MKRFGPWPWLLALACLFLAVHTPRLALPYFWDDHQLIAGNAALQESAWSAWTQPMQPGKAEQAPNYYRPLPFFLLGLMGSLTGFDRPLGMNAMQLGLAFCMAAVFLIFARRSFAPATAFALAAVFAVFPTNIELVAWLSCLPDVLAVTFLLWFVIELERDPGRAAPSRWALVAFAGALLSKEGGIAGLFVALAWDWPRLRRNGWLRLFHFHLPLWLLAWAYLLIRANFVAYAPLRIFAPPLHFRTLGAYAAKLADPWPLSVLIGNNLPVWNWEAYLGVAALLGLAYVIFAAKDPRARTGAAMIAGGLTPYANFIVPPGELYLIAERYMALLVAGVLILAGTGVERLKNRTPALIGLAALALFYAAASRMHYETWQDPILHWTSVIEAGPKKISPYYRRSLALSDAKRYDEARADAERSLANLAYWKYDAAAEAGLKGGRSNIDPLFDMWANRAAAVAAMGQGDYAAAVSHARADYRIKGSLEALVAGLNALDHVPDFEGALKGALRANAAFPSNATIAVMAMKLAAAGGHPAEAWAAVNRSSYRYWDLANAATRDYAALLTQPAFERGVWIYQNLKVVSPAFRQWAQGATGMTAPQLALVADVAYRERMWPVSARFLALALAHEPNPEWAVRRGFALEKMGRRAEACAAWQNAGRSADPELQSILEKLHADCAAH